MKDIKDYTTEELVNELSEREGVELIGIDVTDNCHITINNEYHACIYSSWRGGPEILLRITD